MNDNKTKIDLKVSGIKSINERYNILNTLLNLSTRNKKFFSEEDVFLNDVAKNWNRFDKSEKKNKNNKCWINKFSTLNEEDIFGIKETMTKDQKIKIQGMNSRWNALLTMLKPNEKLKIWDLAN